MGKGAGMAAEKYTYTAFAGMRKVAGGPIREVVPRLQAWLAQGGDAVLVFEDQTGQQVDLDLRGTADEALARLSEHPWLARRADAVAPRSGPGRPKLGVVSREVSLLPRHWDWLGEQPGGASVTLRKLVEARMKQGQGPEEARRARDAAGKFLWVMAGNLPGFEEAMRAFSRSDRTQFEQLSDAWPEDIRVHARHLVDMAMQAEQEAHDGP